MTDTETRLGFGQFYGEAAAELFVDGLSVREVRGLPSRGVPRHTHECAHFCFVLRGACATREGGGIRRRGPSTLVFHPAGTTHEDRFDTGGGSCLMISLPSAFFEAWEAPRPPERSTALDDEELGFAGARMLRELRHPDALSPSAVEGIALEMLAATSSRMRTERSRPAWLPRACDYVREHASEPARVKDVARAVGVHPVHLARAFREHLGLSPSEYLRRVRVRRSIEWIASTAEGLASVAVHAGFCDQSELTKAFARETGTTPAAYRRMLRGR